MKIAFVEDDPNKTADVVKYLGSIGITPDDITHVTDAARALISMTEHRFDILIMDLNIPRRFDEPPSPDGGRDLLRQMYRGNIKLPRYIVGLTAFKEIENSLQNEFNKRALNIIHYDITNNSWQVQLSSLVEHAKACGGVEASGDGRTYGYDLGIVVALHELELNAIRDWPVRWVEVRIPYDHTLYLTATIEINGRVRKLVAAACDRMGMPAAVSLSTKLIQQFRPQYLAMTGITAGMKSKTSYGDIIIADPVWDYGSGKIERVGNKTIFQPSPHQIELEADLRDRVRTLALRRDILSNIKSSFRGKTPDTELSAHVGPLASGAAVIANSAIWKNLKSQHRGVLGLEMEAYGVIVAARSSTDPKPIGIVIKSVCDFADHEKGDDYQKYAAHTSAQFLFKVLESCINFRN